MSAEIEVGYCAVQEMVEGFKYQKVCGYLVPGLLMEEQNFSVKCFHTIAGKVYCQR
jgi:hypothetical protein